MCRRSGPSILPSVLRFSNGLGGIRKQSVEVPRPENRSGQYFPNEGRPINLLQVVPICHYTKADGIESIDNFVDIPNALKHLARIGR